MTEIAQKKEHYDSEDSENEPTLYKWRGMRNDAGRAL